MTDQVKVTLYYSEGPGTDIDYIKIESEYQGQVFESHGNIKAKDIPDMLKDLGLVVGVQHVFGKS
jgi:hypothetical protein